jgi:hypothetical protein
MGTDLKKACENGSLAREDVVKAHRSQSGVDVGLGTAQDFSDKAQPANTSTYVHKPDAKAVGAAVNAEDAHTAPGVEQYLASRSH